MTTGVESFTLGLRNFKVKTEKQAKQAVAKVTLQLLRGFILGNPVDTGRMRAGWVVGVGDAPAYEPPEGLIDKSKGLGMGGASGLAKANVELARLSSLPIGTPIYVVNNVEYSGFVNQRHPNKAKFVQAVIENVATQFDVGAGSSGS